MRAPTNRVNIMVMFKSIMNPLGARLVDGPAGEVMKSAVCWMEDFVVK